MKYLFPFDVFVSMLMLVILSDHTYEWTNTSLPVLGAVIHTAFRLIFCVTSLVNWTPHSNEHWSFTLSNKDYNIEIPCCIVSGVMFTIAGSYLWSWFYIIGIFLLFWGISQIIEFFWLFTYKYIIRHL